MAYDAQTKKDIKDNHLFQEPGRPGWKIRVQVRPGFWKKIGAGKDLDAAIALGRRIRTDTRAFLAERRISLAAKHDWETLVAEYLQYVATHHGGLKKQTKKSIEGIVKRFRAFSKKDPLDVTKDDVQRWYESMKNSGTLRDISSQDYVARLSTFLKFLQGEYALKSCWNQGRALKIKKVRGRARARGVYSTLDEIQEMIAACEPNAEGMKIKFILYAGFYAGLRKAEISYCRRTWIDLKKKTIHIPEFDEFSGFTPKDDTSRHAPIFPEFREFLLHEWRDWTETDYMISGCRADATKGTMRYDFRKIFHNHRKKVGQEKVTIHSMRHSFCTVCMSRKADIKKVADWMGDEIKTVEDHYNHYQKIYAAPDEDYFAAPAAPAV